MDNRDWRSHLNQMHNYRDGIDDALTNTKARTTNQSVVKMFHIISMFQ